MSRTTMVAAVCALAGAIGIGGALAPSESAASAPTDKTVTVNKTQSPVARASARWKTVVCGFGWANYDRCLHIRRAFIKDGYRIGPLRYGAPGCTAPGGCYAVGWHFVYYV